MCCFGTGPQVWAISFFILVENKSSQCENDLRYYKKNYDYCLHGPVIKSTLLKFMAGLYYVTKL